MSQAKYKQPWIGSALADSIFILAPPFLALLVVALFPAEFKSSTTMPLAYWVVLIVMIDVAHVYSTLYRTYFNPLEFKKQQHLLVAIPIFCYIVGVILYAYDGLMFWRVLAYLAVYHFVRQQYGFMRIYSRNQPEGKLAKYIDTAVIYIATIYPLVYWHFAPKRNFNWFVDGDFVVFHSPGILNISLVIYILVIAAYIGKEVFFIIKTGRVNLPKTLIILGTILSWYFGIVYYNGDMAFTTLNVVSHGIPYMALIWFYERKRFDKTQSVAGRLTRITFSRYGVTVFIGLIVFFAYMEEGLWDGLVWKEHASFFKPFAVLPAITGTSMLTMLVPLLSLPQSTHYVLDGFIWKIKRSENKLDFK